MKKILLLFGTRPEAIKMIPVYNELLLHKQEAETRICITAQHRAMLDQVLSFFNVEADYDLDLMKPNQNLYDLSAAIIAGLKPILEDFKPHYVLVHGDTTTTMAGSIAAAYSGAIVGHVEAGLRTYNKKSPFPEELNRLITSAICDLHFAPTHLSKSNLLKENIDESKIVVTGNTVIDALQTSVQLVRNDSSIENYFRGLDIDFSKRIILVTGHRRENFGDGFLNICKALKEIASRRNDVQVVYPVHLNPNVQKPVKELLGDVENVKLLDPLPYEQFVWLMDQSYLIITDSGGVQEEAPSLGKPVLVMRDTTERPEAVTAGTVILVGTDKEMIIEKTLMLLDDEQKYVSMSTLHNPYGDGNASKRIVEFILKKTSQEEYD
ncbi:MAG: UDP-N-acetylglucosamine 2-epimerase (non-hydrolyzing) [Chitinophagaceae bacterium]|nr:UDP-N-acetylglucosamine 2-epimerase (non-hydrolyzing) [Chitinophagaceae bacterium]